MKSASRQKSSSQKPLALPDFIWNDAELGTWFWDRLLACAEPFAVKRGLISVDPRTNEEPVAAITASDLRKAWPAMIASLPKTFPPELLKEVITAEGILSQNGA